MNTERAKRKLSAILSADVKGYSRLMGEDEIATVRTLKEYREAMSKLIKEYRGRVVDSPGDNVLAEFASVVDALECSVEIQKTLKTKNAALPDNRKMEFRIGVNLGDVIEDEDRVYGDGVNIAARIEGLAEPGGICISGSGFEQVRNKLPLGYEYLGEHTVKNIVQPIKVYRILMQPEHAGKIIGEKGPRGTRWRWAAVAVAIILVGGALALWNFYFRPPPIESASKEKMAFPLPDKPSIAVLPFANMTGDASQEFLVDGLTENLITALARVPQLFVIARNSTFVYKNKGVKVQQVAEELGIQYVLEGSVQRSGDKMRITAQFIDALNGRHLWAAHYDREMKDLFQLTDEVIKKVLHAVYIKLTGREEAQLRQRKDPKNTESLLKTFEVVAAMRGLNPKDNAQARRLAEELTTMDPDWSGGFTLLARAHYMDVVLGSSNSPKESLAKALELAQKAVAMDESSPTNYDTLGYVFSLMGEHERALVEFEKGSTLCPSCSDPYMYIGYTQYCLDETDKAIASLQTALRLNPYPPPYYYLHMGNAYRHVGKYEEAISWYKRSLQISPNVQMAYVGLVTSYSLLGREEEARSAAQELLRVNPKFAVEAWAKIMPYKNQEKLARFADALRKAGLSNKPPLPLPDKPSIAVLPFVNMSDDKSQEYFSDGLTEEIISALAKLPQVFVIARNSSFTYKGKAVDVKQVGREMGVRYVLEGSVRREENRIRITAQLIDASTGHHVFSERYDRELKEIFATQEDIALKILTALRVALKDGQWARIQSRGVRNVEAYFKLLEAGELTQRVNKENNAQARRLAEEALALEPGSSRAYQVLAMTHFWDFWLGPPKSPEESIALGIDMAKKAITLDEGNSAAHSTLAMLYVNRGDYERAIEQGERAASLDPDSTYVLIHYGSILMHACQPGEAIPVFEKVLRLDPVKPGSMSLSNLAASYRMIGRYEDSVRYYKRLLGEHPKHWTGHVGLTLTYSLMGREEEARAQAAELLSVDPKFSLERFTRTARWKEPVEMNRNLDALRKAGLK